MLPNQDGEKLMENWSYLELTKKIARGQDRKVINGHKHTHIYIINNIYIYIRKICMYVCMYVWMDACMHACMDGWMDGWMYVCAIHKKIITYII